MLKRGKQPRSSVTWIKSVWLEEFAAVAWWSELLQLSVIKLSTDVWMTSTAEIRLQQSLYQHIRVDFEEWSELVVGQWKIWNNQFTIAAMDPNFR